MRQNIHVIVASIKKVPCLTPTEPRSLFSFFVILSAGADPGFLERGFICITVCVFALLNLSYFTYISLETEII